jgi:uncharacterized protein
MQRAIWLRCVLTALLLWLPSAAKALPGGNLLGNEASPYLQSHAKDGIHWRPWGPAGLAEAKKLNRPIFLSIGYLACHWCHVMQRESFVEGESVALINQLFVPVLIDREERPDLDALYQTAASLLELPTGWPLTMFLSDEGQPFFGATYIPKDEGLGMPAFTDVLRRVSAAHKNDPDGLRRDAAMVGRALAAATQPRAGDVTPAHRTQSAKAYMAEADSLSGGFGEEAKFPNWPALILLWRQHIRTGDEEAGEFVRLSLIEMGRGGLYDHIGNGFFRYTTDPQWRVPHFEKMLDVNAGLLRIMTQVWRETHDDELKQTIIETINFLKKEMHHASGAFISSLDADSLTQAGEEHEGAFYRWRESEVRAVLGGASDSFLAAYAIAPLNAGPTETDPDWGTPYRQGAEVTPDHLRRLRLNRARRPRPRRDDKILADGNGLVIRALAEAGLAFNRPEWTGLARDAFSAASDLLEDDDGRLYQSAVLDNGVGRHGPPATLSAIAAMAHAAISLFEVTGEIAYMQSASAWAGLIVDHHGDPVAAGFFASAQNATAVPVRLKPIFDDPNPSGNAATISLFARLYFHTGKANWRKLATRTLQAFGAAAEIPTLGTASLMNAADDLMAALQVVIIGDRQKPDAIALLAALTRRSLPAQVLQVIKPGSELPDNHPARFKQQIDGQATAYVCRGTVCSLPAITRSELDENLAIFRKDPK